MNASTTAPSLAPPLPVRNAARMVFFVSGFITAAWAPLVPYAKSRLDLDEASLGLLLLCLGAGSLATMPIAAPLAARFGCRSVSVLSALVACAVLPLLAIAPSLELMAGALLFFGASLGIVDVVQNIHATKIQKLSGRPMMSGFHALYSVGGFTGAGGASLLLLWGLTPVGSSLVVAGIALLLLLCWGRHMLRDASPKQSALFALPRGPVLLLGVLCFIMFLAEGAILDWSAVFLSDRGMALSDAGIGYSLFAIAMTMGRLTGDKMVRLAGGPAILTIGSLSAAAGFALAVFAPSPAIGLAGFILIGLGASNLVPVLFTEAGNQTAVPAHLAIASISLLGYSGSLAGPALIGFLAHATSLNTAFAMLGFLTLAPAVATSFLFSRKRQS